MKQKIDINTWKRKEHYNFFNAFDEPIYGVTVSIDCTAAYAFAKENKVSFFLYTVYQALQAAKLVEEFKYRIEGDDVFVYDNISASVTVGRDNGTFGFGYMDYHADFDQFMDEAGKSTAAVKALNTLAPQPRHDVLLISSLPWVNFTSISHARIFSFKSSSPAISFGKITEKHGRRVMPMSVHVHHALVDGMHIGQFVDAYQELLDKGI